MLRSVLRLITLNLRILAMMHYMLYIPDFGRGPVRSSFSKMTPNDLCLHGQKSFWDTESRRRGASGSVARRFERVFVLFVFSLFPLAYKTVIALPYPV